MVYNAMSSATRRSVLKATGSAVGIGALAGCLSEDNGNGDGGGFPQQNIEIVIPFGPGGGYDEYTRTISPYLSESLPNDVDIINTNMEGSSGRIATVEVYNSAPDGYTNMIVNEDLVMQQLLEDNTDFDLAEMTYYANLAIDTAGIAVSGASGIETVGEFVEGVQNEEVRFALSGITDALAPAVFGEVSGLYDSTNVLDNAITYEGRGAAIQGVMGGDAEAMTGSFYSILPYVEEENMDMLMEISTEDEPPEETPDAETLTTAEISNAQDIMDLSIDGRTFAGPPGVDSEITETLRDAFEDAAHDDEFVTAMDDLDRPVEFLNGEEAQQSIENRFEQWEENYNILEAIYG